MILQIEAPKKLNVQVVCLTLENRLGKLVIGYNRLDEVDGVLKQIRESTEVLIWL